MKILCILACALGILSSTAAVPVSICKPDLGLVVDRTKSLGSENIQVLKDALVDLVQKFDISEDTTHVSLETFFKRATVHNKFNDPAYWSVSAVIDLINNSFNKLRSPTRVDLALEAADKIMYTAANGDRSGEVNVLVVFTDGRTQDQTDFNVLTSAVESLTNVKGTLIIAVAIGDDATRPGSQRVLTQIAGNNIIYIDDYQSLSGAIDEIFHKICYTICKRDLGFVVDRTKSLGSENLPVLKEALADLVQKFDISEDKTHVSYETFFQFATVHNRFNDPAYWSVSAVIDLINTSFNKLRSPTFIDRAIQTANNTMFTVENGDRPGDMNVLVAFTDGRTNDNSDFYLLKSNIASLKLKGVFIIAVAIGPDATRPGSQKVLAEIAGDNIIYLDDYQSLGGACDEIFNLICHVPEVVPH